MAIIPTNRAELADFCREHGIRQLALFGSAARGEQRVDSDVDLLVEFLPDRVPGLLGISRLELDLSQYFEGRKIDLRTIEDLSPYFRDDVIRESQVLYAQA